MGLCYIENMLQLNTFNIGTNIQLTRLVINVSGQANMSNFENTTKSFDEDLGNVFRLC